MFIQFKSVKARYTSAYNHKQNAVDFSASLRRAPRARAEEGNVWILGFVATGW